MRPRIATLLARYGTERYAEALPRLDRFFEERLPNAIRTTVVVDNASPRTELRKLAPAATMIGGDNSFWEFSAWDRGLAYLDRIRERPDLVHFATSAFGEHYVDFIDRFDPGLLDAGLAANAAIGHIDHFDEPVELLGRESQHWLRTSFFFLPISAVWALRSMVSFEDATALFSDDPEHPFRKGAPLSARFQSYIRSWLTGDGTGQGVVWHGRFDLTGETLPYFKRKAMAVLNEHLLTIRLRGLEYPVVDVSWLSSQLQREHGASVDWQRSWREQVADRGGKGHR